MRIIPGKVLVLYTYNTPASSIELCARNCLPVHPKRTKGGAQAHVQYDVRFVLLLLEPYINIIPYTVILYGTTVADCGLEIGKCPIAAYSELGRR
jgi:hypothetical protein